MHIIIPLLTRISDVSRLIWLSPTRLNHPRLCFVRLFILFSFLKSRACQYEWENLLSCVHCVECDKSCGGANVCEPKLIIFIFNKENPPLVSFLDNTLFHSNYLTLFSPLTPYLFVYHLHSLFHPFAQITSSILFLLIFFVLHFLVSTLDFSSGSYIIIFLPNPFDLHTSKTIDDKCQFRCATHTTHFPIRWHINKYAASEKQIVILVSPSQSIFSWIQKKNDEENDGRRSCSIGFAASRRFGRFLIRASVFYTLSQGLLILTTTSSWPNFFCVHTPIEKGKAKKS